MRRDRATGRGQQQLGSRDAASTSSNGSIPSPNHGPGTSGKPESRGRHEHRGCRSWTPRRRSKLPGARTARVRRQCCAISLGRSSPRMAMSSCVRSRSAQAFGLSPQTARMVPSSCRTTRRGQPSPPGRRAGDDVARRPGRSHQGRGSRAAAGHSQPKPKAGPLARSVAASVSASSDFQNGRNPHRPSAPPESRQKPRALSQASMTSSSESRS